MATAPASPPEPDTDDRLPLGAPPEIARAAAGDASREQMTGKEERTAVGWLLGPVAALPFTVDVKYDTPDGLKPLRFHMIQLDAAQLDIIERRNRNGEGPFAELQARTYNAEAVAAATRFVEDLTDGSKLALSDPEFRMGIPSPAIALEKRFAFQPGILRGLVAEIREMAGNSEDRIGTAQRAIVDAAGNS